MILEMQTWVTLNPLDSPKQTINRHQCSVLINGYQSAVHILHTGYFSFGYHSYARTSLGEINMFTRLGMIEIYPLAVDRKPHILLTVDIYFVRIILLHSMLLHPNIDMNIKGLCHVIIDTISHRGMHP